MSRLATPAEQLAVAEAGGRPVTHGQLARAYRTLERARLREELLLALDVLNAEDDRELAGEVATQEAALTEVVREA